MLTIDKNLKLNKREERLTANKLGIKAQLSQEKRQ